MNPDDTELLAAAPATAYREYLYRPHGELARWIGTRFDIVARPCQPIYRPLREGDVLLEVTLGRTSPGQCTVLAARDLQFMAPQRRLAPGQLLLRPRSGEEAPHRDWSGADADSADPNPWQGTAEQEDFRARVLAEHIARSRKARGAPQRDLRKDELSDIPGTCSTTDGSTACVQTKPGTAEAAGQLLKAANADLGAARQRADADALRTVKLTATSGYRGSDTQQRLWLRYFATKYYKASYAARAKISDGPHSDAAVDYMLRSRGEGGFGIPGRIAAPGYSNHQGGIAIDFWQERTKGNGIGNDSDDQSRCRWRQSWFHGWLRTHAAAFGFQPIATEEWHWEHRPAATASSDQASYRGGKLWTFASAAHPQPVAVFCPKAALGRQDVDVLVFAHGLLGGCPRPKRLPAGFVTDAPFELGRIVDRSGRPVVLVVPLIDWGNPCGEVVFGRDHRRWHPLGEPAVLNAVVSEVLAEVGRVQGASAPSLRELIVAGHSRAYDVLEPLAAHRTDAAIRQGALARLSQVWAFDTTYAGDVPAWTDWLRLNPSLQLHLYYRSAANSPTRTVGERFYAQRGDRLFVTRVDEVHCAVPATRLAELMPAPAAATPAGEESAEALDLALLPRAGGPAPDVPSTECLQRVAGLKVAVVGGGLGGLMAARTLARWGASVTVYEARAQVGGRVLSDSTFANGRITELGAELVGSIHTRWCALARQYGISLISRMDGDLYGGQQLQQRMILDRLLTPEEIAKITEDQRLVLRRIAELARQSIDSGNESQPWNQARNRSDLVAFDRMSVADALEHRFGVTPNSRLWKAMELLLVNNNVAPLERSSFLALLCLVRGGQTVAPDPLMGYWDKLEIYRCGDGCQRLAQAIAAEVEASKGCRIVRNLGVRRIDLRPQNGGVLVTARSTKNTPFDKWLRDKVEGNPLIEIRHYDYVVFAVPPTVWSYVEVTPHHPKDVIGLMGSGPAVKFFSNVRQRFWIKDGFAPLGGSLDIGQVWEGTDNQTRVKGQDIVLSVFTGSRAPSENDYKRGLDHLYPRDPGRTGSGYLANLRDTKLFDWSRQAFIQTGYSSPRTGQVFTIGKELNEPFEGRLFFAGEHTQMDHFGYMEGAIRSGERAARMLLDHVCPTSTEPSLLAVAGG
jgi:monoamine oxidase